MHMLCFQNLMFYYESDTCNRPSGVLLLEGCYCERLITAGCAAKNKDGTDNKQVGFRKLVVWLRSRIIYYIIVPVHLAMCSHGQKAYIYKCQTSFGETSPHLCARAVLRLQVQRANSFNGRLCSVVYDCWRWAIYVGAHERSLGERWIAFAFNKWSESTINDAVEKSSRMFVFLVAAFIGSIMTPLAQSILDSFVRHSNEISTLMSLHLCRKVMTFIDCLHWTRLFSTSNL